MKKAQKPEEFKGRSMHMWKGGKQIERTKGLAEYECQSNPCHEI